MGSERRSARAILNDSHRDVGAHRTFKVTFVVIGLIGFDAGEPHLCFTKFTKWTADNALLRENFVFSHATPPRVDGAAFANSTITREERKRVSIGDRSGPFS